MQTWLARLLNQPVAQGAVAEVRRKMERGGGGDIRVPGENGKIRVLFLCFSVCSTYLCGCVCVAAAVLNKI